MTQSPFPLWQDQLADADFTNPAASAARVSQFERKIRRRNALEYLAGGFVGVAFLVSAVAAVAAEEWLFASGMALSATGVLVLLWGLKRRASNLVRRPEDACLTHLRWQYQRQYDALRAVPLWYIGPLVPGMTLFYFAVLAESAEHLGWSAAVEELARPAGTTIAVFVGVALLNLWAARGLKRDIAKLDKLA
ncbi:MAG: hypothetical protein AAF697_14425 [Pseudomonadota bacterium]